MSKGWNASKRLGATGLGCLTKRVWVVVEDGMTGVSFLRLPALLCMYREVYYCDQN